MSKHNQSNFTDAEFVEIVNSCPTMALAAKKLGMAYMTFKRKAIKLGCYKPNQSKKGVKCNEVYGYRKNRIPTEDILAGKHPEIATYKLKIRLIREGYLKDECSICGWNKKPEGQEFTPYELDHINGNPTDHRLENLRIICPNCHSLTETYRFRRGKTNEAQGRKLLDANEANSTNGND
jgi:5-methylcytosine-specific restriction endonuclease McrA